MKIAFFCAEYPPRSHGGVGTFTYTVAHGMADRGHEVMVVEQGKSYAERDDAGVCVITIPQYRIPKISWLLSRIRIYRWLKRRVRAGLLDVIEIPELDGILPFRFDACPVFVRLHSSGKCVPRHMEEAKTGIKRILERRTLSKNRFWIAVSNYILHETQQGYGITPSKARVIYNPVETDEFMKLPTVSMTGDYVLYAGTVSKKKGAFVLAEAARHFLPRFPNLHLVYVGRLTTDKDRRADDIIRTIVGHELAMRIHFTGPVGHNMVLAYMKKARVFAFPSKLEALGLVTIEAMSCGVPVVYSASHAGPEVIDDGVTGLLADPDSPGNVAEKVIRLIDDPVLSDRLAEKAKQVVKERFSLERCIDETLAFYERIIRERRQ